MTTGYFIPVPCNRIVTGTFKLPYLKSEDKRLPSIDDLSNPNLTSQPPIESLELHKNLEEDSSEDDPDQDEKDVQPSPPNSDKDQFRQQPTDDTSTSQAPKQPFGLQFSPSQDQGITKSSADL